MGCDRVNGIIGEVEETRFSCRVRKDFESKIELIEEFFVFCKLEVFCLIGKLLLCFLVLELRYRCYRYKIGRRLFVDVVGSCYRKIG